MNQDFQVKIGTTADTTGAKAAAAALQDVGNAAKQGAAATTDQGRASQEAGKNILSLGETTEKGIGIGRMFSEVLQGNFYALGNVTAALKVTGAAMKTSVVGIALLALTALAQFLPTLIDKLKGPKDSLEDGFDAARKAAEKLNEAKIEALKTNLDVIAASASNARSEMDALQAAADKLDDADMAAQLAENKVAPGLTEDQRAANEREIRGRFAQRKQERKLGAMKEAEQIAQAEVEALASASTSKGGELAAARAKVEEAANRRTSLQERIRAIEIEQSNLGPTVVSKDGSMSEEAITRAKRATQLTKEKAALDREFTSLKDPNVVEAEERDRRNLAARERDFVTSQRALLSGLNAFDLVRRKNEIQRKTDEELNRPGGPVSRRAYAENYGAVMDTRTEPDPVFKPETVIRDARSIREGGNIDTKAVTEINPPAGAKTAAQMAEEVQQRNAALRAGMVESVRALNDPKRPPASPPLPSTAAQPVSAFDGSPFAFNPEATAAPRDSDSAANRIADEIIRLLREDSGRAASATPSPPTALDTSAIVQSGIAAGRELAADIAEAMKQRDDAIRAEVRRLIAAQPRGGN